MEVNGRTLRKLISDNYSYIISAPGSSRGNDFRILNDMVRNIASSPETAKEKFADAITPDTPEPSKVFKDFDLAAFFSCLGLDAFQRTVLALGFKDHPREDLRLKGLEVLQRAFPSTLETLANPNKHSEMSADSIAHILHGLLDPPIRPLLEDSDALKLSFAARSRYKHTSLPPQIFDVTEPVERLRQQESLVNTLQQVGPNEMNYLELLRGKGIVHISEAEVADILTFMATSIDPLVWDAGSFVQAVQAVGALPQNFDWAEVIEHLDREDFLIEAQGFQAILDAFSEGVSALNFPLDKLWGGRWTHSRAHWTILRAFLKTDHIDITKLTGIQKVLSSDDFTNASSSLQLMVATFETHKLISYAAVEALLLLSLDEDGLPDVRDAARQELDRAAKYTPELILCGALMMPPPWPPNLDTIIERLFAAFFDGHTSYQMVFWRLWQMDKKLVTQRFVDAYMHNPLSVTRILDIAQELRCLSDLLEVPSAMFVLDVASLAARREHLNLEKWLQDMLSKYGADFWGECYRFLRIKADAEYMASREGSKSPMVGLRVGPVNTFLTVLDSSQPPMGQELQEQVTQTQRICIQAYPRLINMGNGFDSIILRNNDEGNTFSTSIDKDMQSNYRALYAQETEIRMLVDYMQKLKKSTIPKEQDLFACMIHGLFDEYDCYPNYPIQALATTSVLFGSIIRYKVIDGIPLRVALAMVYQAVRDHTTSTSMYKFGLQALVQFQERLREWRSYCMLLAQVPGLQGTDVWSVVQEVVSGGVDRQIEAPGLQQPASNGGTDRETEAGTPDLPNGNNLPPSPQSKPPFRSLYADSPSEGVFEDPNEDVQDKVLFIVNNVSQSNLENKLKELREWLEEAHHQWFADYLVVKRAKMEPNYHGLYLDLLTKFGHKGLVNEVLRETYVNVIKLLNAETTLSNSTERTHLKNLGAWLGGLTLAKDKPIKFKNISFKDLIIEGWETDRLIVVLPFTCKVLEQATKSTAFRPPNPWLMAILRLLKEMYDNVALKLNLKFEIEVLCKNLGLDVKDIEAATDIAEVKERQAVKEVEAEEEAALLDNLSLQQQEYPPISHQIPPTFSENIAINPIIRDVSVKRVIINAIERTAHEILGPVVERSVAIATIATTQLIQKDFATEPDENKLRTAAIGMAQRLAGHLALVTCKEPMRLSMVNNIRAGLLQSGYNESAVSEQAITMIVNDNLEYVCQTVEAAAERESVPQVDDSLRGAYQMRKRYRESRTGQPFVSPDVSRYALQLPDVFRLKPGGLTPQQLSVYDEFARASPVTAIEPAKGQTLDGYEYLPTNFQQGTAGIVDASSVERQRPLETQAPVSPPPPAYDQTQYQEKVAHAIRDMRQIAEGCEEHGIDELSPDHPVIQYRESILHHIGIIPNSHKLKETVLRGAASLLCNMIYEDDLPSLAMESMVTLLRGLCDISPNTGKEVNMYLTGDKEDGVTERIPPNVKTTIVLLKNQLLMPTDLDQSLSKLIAARKPIALEFLSGLLKETEHCDEPLLYRTDFATSFDAIGEWIKQDPSNQAASTLLKDLHNSEEEDEERNLRDQMEYIFVEWVQLYQHISTTEKNYQAFIVQLHHAKYLGDLPRSVEFFRSCIEHCIDEYESQNRNGSSIATNCYIPIDAFAKMVMLLVRYQVDDAVPGEQLNKVQYFESMLANVVFVFNHHYETRSDNLCFKVFFRFFSSLLFEYRSIESQLGECRERILELFADCFLTLQPAFFPLFAFHWATLISHRFFMPRLLSTPTGQPVFTKLLGIFLSWIGSLLKQQQPLQGVIKILHQGALRLLLVLHHDFPTYLAEYYFPIVDAIPTECTQLRNLVLSTLPPSLAEFPDPFANGLQIKHLPAIKDTPLISGDIPGPLQKAGLKGLVDSIIQSNRAPAAEQISSITERLESPPSSGMVTVDVGTMNSLVLYVGMDAIQTAEAQELSVFEPESVHATLLFQIAVELKPYGRHFFLSAAANHLRYPSSHTYYFHCLILHIFDRVSGLPQEERVREQIARVLVERLVVHRPHPWGLIITLLEMFRSRDQEFWNLPAVRQAPEVSRLFSAVLP
ncbi:CCR4-Not complex component, Not1-domain-containing protein [Sphaerosporella brunnea]|uniref:General negative regulator of transcription subunit 1 n=1 Tax=Sphaerosporella brunnea TaxID=1250544 RepID=A0A5J5F9V8_9PEZI|nr:CCR4-Not complex component, Not1-domain-containing protein [Sphaerosporella brunnea]